MREKLTVIPVPDPDDQIIVICHYPPQFCGTGNTEFECGRCGTHIVTGGRSSVKLFAFKCRCGACNALA